MLRCRIYAIFYVRLALMSDVWAQAKAILEHQMARSQFVGLIRDTDAVLQGDILTVFANSEFDIDWLNRLKPVFEQAIKKVVKRDVKVDIQVKGQEQIKSEKDKDNKEGKEDNTLEIYGYTPIFDVVANRLGTMPALVFGVVWRHCQMSRGVCTASVARLAGLTGVSEKTIRRYLTDLCQNGYLIDKTPDIRNKPHIYEDAGKVRFRVSVQAIVD